MDQNGGPPEHVEAAALLLFPSGNHGTWPAMNLEAAAADNM